MKETLRIIAEEFNYLNEEKKKIESKSVKTEQDIEDLKAIEELYEYMSEKINNWATEKNNQLPETQEEIFEKNDNDSLRERFEQGRKAIENIKNESKSMQPQISGADKMRKDEILEQAGFIKTNTVDDREIRIHPSLVGKYHDLVKEQKRLTKELNEEYYKNRENNNFFQNESQLSQDTTETLSQASTKESVVSEELGLNLNNEIPGPDTNQKLEEFWRKKIMEPIQSWNLQSNNSISDSLNSDQNEAKKTSSPMDSFEKLNNLINDGMKQEEEKQTETIKPPKVLASLEEQEQQKDEENNENDKISSSNLEEEWAKYYTDYLDDDFTDNFTVLEEDELNPEVETAKTENKKNPFLKMKDAWKSFATGSETAKIINDNETVIEEETGKNINDDEDKTEEDKKDKPISNFVIKVRKMKNSAEKFVKENKEQIKFAIIGGIAGLVLGLGINGGRTNINNEQAKTQTETNMEAENNELSEEDLERLQTIGVLPSASSEFINGNIENLDKNQSIWTLPSALSQITDKTNNETTKENVDEEVVETIEEKTTPESENSISAIGNKITVQEGTRIHNNMYDAYLGENSYSTYYNYDEERKIIGVGIVNENGMTAIFASDENYEQKVNDLIQNGGEIVSVLTANNKYLADWDGKTPLTLDEIKAYNEGWYNVNDITNNNVKGIQK